MGSLKEPKCARKYTKLENYIFVILWSTISFQSKNGPLSNLHLIDVETFHSGTMAQEKLFCGLILIYSILLSFENANLLQ